MERILIVCDFHEECRKAIEKALDLANKDSFLYILYPVNKKFHEIMGKTAHKNLKRVVHEKAREMKSKGFRCRGMVKIGEPLSDIARIAKRSGCDLIIIGYKEGGIFSRYSMEDVSQKIMNLSSLPVMIVC
jgi:nucleotide-binding universal stress UspA family protein